jgi:regulator of RNase E activity RraA
MGQVESPREESYDQVLRDLRTVSTATIASQLRKRNINGCTMDGLRTSKHDKKLIGRARTLRYLPLREDLYEIRSSGMNAQKRAVEQIGTGEVLVISARGDRTAGTIGDILAMRTQARGAAGIVTDGAVRDSAAIDALAIPVYSSAAHPAVLGRRHVPWECDVAVDCAGVLVEPGDIIVGDADGVVVIPLSIAAEVVSAALEQERQETFIAEQVSAGASITGLYPIGPTWKAAYETWTQESDPQ